jgi:hypothetical protein
MTSTPQITSLHAVYGALTGLTLELDFYRESCWQHWMAKGWLEPDLRMVVKSIQAGIKKGTRRTGALKFNNLIAMTDRFEEDLSEARAAARVHRMPLHQALTFKASGRSTDLPTQPAKPVSEIALQILRDFRRNNV